EKPYPCPHCDKFFCDVFIRNKHIRDVHNMKPYSCLTCGEKFDRYAFWRLHLAMNEGHQVRNEESLAFDSHLDEGTPDEEPIDEEPGPSRPF
ncbi:hypothetical protein PMAYCL1PPCAC_20056, partial [Pristionchus mayeri]